MSYQPKALFGNLVVDSRENQTPKNLFGGSPPLKVVISNSPKILFGESNIRRRIEVSMNDLSALNNCASNIALKIAREQIIRTNIDELNLETVLNWGALVQEKHKTIIDTLLNLSAEKEVGHAKGLLLKLIDLIGLIDFTSINKKTMFGASKESKIDKVNEIFSDIQKIGANCLSKVDKLQVIWDDLNKIESQLSELLIEVEPFIISCSFFANYKKDNFPNPLFISRLSSLLSTKITLTQNQQSQQFVENLVINLIDTIQSVVRTEIPMWQSNYINLLTQGISTVNLEGEKNTILNKIKKTISVS